MRLNFKKKKINYLLLGILILLILSLNGCQLEDKTTGNAGGDSSNGEVTDPTGPDPVLKGFNLSAVSGDTDESGGQVSFTIALTEKPIGDVTVSFRSTNTKEGTVFPELATFTSVNWNSKQTIIVTGVDDSSTDLDQTFNIVVEILTSNDPEYTVIEDVQVSVVNRDDETPGFVIKTIDSQTSEAGDQGSFSMRLQAPSAANVVISMSVSNSNEATILGSQSLTFTPLNWEAYQTVSVEGKDDPTLDGNQTYNIQFSPAVSTDLHYNGRVPSEISFTNQDNETAGLSANFPGASSSSESGVPITLKVNLTAPPVADVSFTITSSDGSEGLVTPANLTLTSDNWNGLHTLTITGQDDDLADGNVAYDIIFDNFDSADASYSELAPINVSLTNIDNETAGILVTNLSGNSHEADPKNATFDVQLAGKPANTVAISVSSTDESEGVTNPTVLNFDENNWNSVQMVTVTGKDDSVADGDRDYSINLNPAGSADSAYAALSVVAVNLQNIDDETAGLTVSPLSGLTTTEMGGSASFTVKLNCQPSTKVTLSVESLTPSEGYIPPTTLSFTPVNWNNPQTVIVYGKDDDIADGNQPYQVRVSISNTDDPLYGALAPVNVSVTNTDNETADYIISATSGLLTDENAGTDSFTIRLTSQPTDSVVIPVTSSDPGEGLPSPDSLTFTPLNWETPQMVTITGVDDDIDDGTQAYTIIMGIPSTSNDANYKLLDPPDISIKNDSSGDYVGISVSQLSTITSEWENQASFNIKLNSDPTADVFIAVTSLDMGEGSVLESVNYGTYGAASGDDLIIYFDSSNWESGIEVFVKGVADSTPDGDTTFDISVGSSTSADSGYLNLAPDISILSFNNWDWDKPEFLLVKPSSNTTEASGDTTFKVNLKSRPDQDVTLSFSVDKPTEVDISPDSVTFTNIDWINPETWQIVTLTGKDDATFDGRQSTLLSTTVTTSDLSYGALGGIGPFDVTNDSISLVGLGRYHSCAVIGDSTVRCWGRGTFGQVGNGNTVDSNTQQTVITSADVTIDSAIGITGGENHSCVLINGGKIYCWGDNAYGQLGWDNTDTTDQLKAREVIGINNATQISAGANHTCALLDTGGIKCWGRNNVHQLGIDATEDTSNQMTPVVVSGLSSSAVNVAAGTNSSCAVLDTKIIECWGEGSYGQLGWKEFTVPEENYDSPVPVPVLNISNALEVSAGYNYACARLDATSDNLRCWGRGALGQLGDGLGLKSYIPVTVTGVSYAVGVTAGYEHACTLISTGEVKCWGKKYELGLQFGTDQLSPITLDTSSAVRLSAGGATCLSEKSGLIRCRGQNFYYRLGIGDNWNFYSTLQSIWE